jgi:hypothetical protein
MEAFAWYLEKEGTQLGAVEANSLDARLRKETFRREMDTLLRSGLPTSTINSSVQSPRSPSRRPTRRVPISATSCKRSSTRKCERPQSDGVSDSAECSATIIVKPLEPPPVSFLDITGMVLEILDNTRERNPVRLFMPGDRFHIVVAPLSATDSTGT